MTSKTCERFQTLRKILILKLGGRCEWVYTDGHQCECTGEGDVMDLEFHHVAEKPRVYGKRAYYIIQQIWEFGRTGDIPKDIKLYCPLHHKKADRLRAEELKNGLSADHR